MTDLAARLARDLPDVPRWIDARAMLLSGHARVFGVAAIDEGFAVRLLHGAQSAVAVVGRPPADAIRDAIHGTTTMTPIVVHTENADYVERVLADLAASMADGWTRERAILHRLTAGASEREPASSTPTPSDAIVRLLTADDPLDHLPDGLRFEITHAREVAPVAAVFDGHRAVSMCYPCWRTEHLWDVSIDTLESHRRRGLAAYAVQYMIDVMRRDGREPVWGAVESNDPSLRLAARLGFTPVDEAVIFARGRWAYFTAGFV